MIDNGASGLPSGTMPVSIVQSIPLGVQTALNNPLGVAFDMPSARPQLIRIAGTTWSKPSNASSVAYNVETGVVLLTTSAGTINLHPGHAGSWSSDMNTILGGILELDATDGIVYISLTII